MSWIWYSKTWRVMTDRCSHRWTVVRRPSARAALRRGAGALAHRDRYLWCPSSTAISMCLWALREWSYSTTVKSRLACPSGTCLSELLIFHLLFSLWHKLHITLVLLMAFYINLVGSKSPTWFLAKFWINQPSLFATKMILDLEDVV